MKTIIGYLDKQDDAKGLVMDLTQQGFRRESIEIGKTAGGEMEKGEKKEGFFQKLFGSPKEETHEGAHGYYPEAQHGESTFVAVSVKEADAFLASEIMRRHSAKNIEERPGEWHSTSMTEEEATLSTQGEEFYPRSGEAIEGRSAEEDVVPVVEEEVQVGKREVPKGKLHVTKRVTETPVEEELKLREEQATVERRPVDRPLSEADEAEAFRETSFEVSEFAEEPVVAKEARVKEEVVIGKKELERTATIKETVRRTDVDVEEEDFGRYYNTLPAGEDYEGHRSAFSRGAELKSDNRYEGKNWADVEEEIRADWERDRPGTWEKYRDTIRYRWDKRA